jgi:uncharacterized protein (TIGR03437 family)
VDATSGPAPDLAVNLEGVPVPLVAANAGELDVQIPWQVLPSSEFPAFPMTLHSSSSPFESVVQLDLETAAPAFERTGVPMDGQREIIVAHQDFHGVVTRADPAAPGEIVHAYMTGLGEVQPTPPTGSAPTALSNVSIRPLCWVQPPARPQETAGVTFAGLAPGMIGMYQVDIAIPADIAATLVTLTGVEQFPPIGVVGDFGTLFIAAHQAPLGRETVPLPVDAHAGDVRWSRPIATRAVGRHFGLRANEVRGRRLRPPVGYGP